jgi:hypothetical protein
MRLTQSPFTSTLARDAMSTVAGAVGPLQVPPAVAAVPAAGSLPLHLHGDAGPRRKLSGETSHGRKLSSGGLLVLLWWWPGGGLVVGDVVA